MKNFISKNKFKILLTLVFAFLLLILNNNVFATTFNTSIGTLTCPDELIEAINSNVAEINDPNYKFFADHIYKSSTTYTSVWAIDMLSNSNIKIYYRGDGYIDSTLSYSNPCKGYLYEFLMSSDGSYYLAQKSDYRNFDFDKWSTSILDGYFYSTIDVYTDNTYTELFFQVAPPEEEIPEIPETPEEETPKEGTLQEIMEQVEKEAVLKEIVALLPVILSVLVSLIALRKGLKMLLDFLRTS